MIDDLLLWLQEVLDQSNARLSQFRTRHLFASICGHGGNASTNVSSWSRPGRNGSQATATFSLVRQRADLTGSSVAAVAKALRVLMTEALKDVGDDEDSPLDVLRARRERRLREGRR